MSGLGLALLTLAVVPPAAGQQPITLEDAVRTALAQGPRAAVARADSLAAAARVRTARQFPDPAVALDWSKDPPNRHAELEQPLEYPWLRSARVGGAQAEADAATLRSQIERARIRYDVTVAYAEASSARAILVVSRQNVVDGDELVRIASVRRDAGDASDLDVDLAVVNAAQQRSTLLTDSLALVTATLRLQAELGLGVDSAEIVPADSFALAAPVVPPARLEVTAAEAEHTAAAARLREQRAARLPVPTVRIGFEQGQPAGEDQSVLPAGGVTFTIPILSGNRGGIGEARAALQHAEAVLALARIQGDLAVAQTERTRTLAAARLQRDEEAVVAAQRVAGRSLTAYSEGAYPLASVLEAQRLARDAVRQFLEDATALHTAEASLTLAALTGVLP